MSKRAVPRDLDAPWNVPSTLDFGRFTYAFIDGRGTRAREMPLSGPPADSASKSSKSLLLARFLDGPASSALSFLKCNQLGIRVKNKQF